MKNTMKKMSAVFISGITFWFFLIVTTFDMVAAFTTYRVLLAIKKLDKGEYDSLVEDVGSYIRFMDKIGDKLIPEKLRF